MRTIVVVILSLAGVARADTGFELPDVPASRGLGLGATPLIQPERSPSGTIYNTDRVQEALRPDEPPSELDDPYAPPFATVHSGLYFRASGLVVDQLNDVQNTDTGDTAEFNTGGGFTLAIGYRDFQVPLAFEFEYAFRSADTSGDGSVNLNTIGANILFDASDLIGPIGFYAGGGIGVQIDYLRVVSVGGSTSVGINGSGFFYQAMGGVSVSLSDRFQLYSGVRWVDGGIVSEDPYRLNSQSVNYEIGLKYFF